MSAASSRRLRWMAAAVLAAAGTCAGADERSDAKDAYREGYQRGYDEGFERGYRKGLDESRTAAAPVAPSLAGGPITVSGAYYGTSSHNCDATRYVARRANGKRSYSFEVSNDICGDPSHGERKSLEVTYACGGLAKTASANEHRTIVLDCAP